MSNLRSRMEIKKLIETDFMEWGDDYGLEWPDERIKILVNKLNEIIDEINLRRRKYELYEEFKN